MQLNSDFDLRAVVDSGSLEWTPSPIPGVDRRMLDRIGDEVARATSIVRYAPHSQFSPHVHTGGEEFFVLDGVFQDEHGDFPAGSYIRNPPQSKHTPGSEPGCVIFVKLWQFDPDDRTHVRIDTNKMMYIRPADRRSVEVMSLFKDRREEVRLEKWDPGAEVILEDSGGLEILVLEGSYSEGGHEFLEHAWLRLPKGAPLHAVAGEDGCKVWVKSGHLLQPQTAPKITRS